MHYAREWRSKDAELYKRIQDYNFVIVTETKSKKNERFNVPDYFCLQKNNYKDGAGGADGIAFFKEKYDS